MSMLNFDKISQWKHLEFSHHVDEFTISLWWYRLIITTPRIHDHSAYVGDRIFLEYVNDYNWFDIGLHLNSGCCSFELGKFMFYLYRMGIEKVGR